MIFNPFRDVWVSSMRSHMPLPAAGDRDTYTSRTRSYAESTDLNSFTPLQYWTGPDLLDPSYYEPSGEPPELYNLDAVAYESVMVGMFTWWNAGVPYPGYDDPGPRVNELGVGFSRDGYHWERPTRGGGDEAFIPASNEDGTWNGYNTQSAAGNFVVVGDELWFYFAGRSEKKPFFGDTSTGMAKLRRDGFYSMDAGANEGTLTTRPVQFSGQHLFVNVDNPSGQLRVEVLDQNGDVIAPFSKSNSIPISADKTLVKVDWNGGGDLSSLSGTPVRFRFHLTDGDLYSFWVSDSVDGASNGYVASGGPGFTGRTDTVGQAGYVPSNDASNAQNERFVVPEPSLPATVTPEAFLDISNLVERGYGRGIQSLAFHPEFDQAGAAGEGKLYVIYSAPTTLGGDHDTVVSEFKVSSSDPDQVDALSERVLLRFDQPEVTGNGGAGGDGIPIDDSDLGRKGGWLSFGPDDGLLYVATEAGFTGQAQNLNSLLGKVLRIDVDGSNGPGGAYGIPSSNPFVTNGAARDEIYAFGFNHPRHLWFDDGPQGALSSDRLFVTDAGLSGLEEINLVDVGGNYGWGVVTADPVGLTAPIAQYRKSGYGESVLGGNLYDGSNVPQFDGRYVMADTIGQLRTLNEDGSTWELQVNETFGDTFSAIAGFDQQVYVSTPNTLYQLTQSTSDLPPWLSLDPDTGVFSGTPGSRDAGTANIEVTVTDTVGETVSDLFELTVGHEETTSVTLAASDSLAAEPGDDAEFTVTRSGSVTRPLTIYYNVEGTALAGADYELLSGWVTIPIGQQSATISVEVLDDAEIEFGETVILTLLDDPWYDLSGVTTATATISSDEQVPVELLAHWTFDETGGNTAADQSGAGNVGVLAGDPTWTSGRIGGGLALDGNDDSVDGGLGAAIVGVDAFSVAAWIRTSAEKDQVIIQQRSPHGYNGAYMLQLLSSGQLYFWTFGGGFLGPTVASSRLIDDGQWHHVAGVREQDGTMRLYIDGVLEASTPGSPRPLVALNVYVGADERNNNRYFEGTIDDVRVYDRAIDAAEAEALAGHAGGIQALNDSLITNEQTLVSVSAPGLLLNDLGDGLSVSAIDSTSTLGVSVSGGADGSFQYNPVGQFDSLSEGDTLSDTFSYTISDGSATDSATVTITITGVNDPPVAAANTVSTSESESVNIDVLAGDTDVDSTLLTVSGIDTTGTIGTVTLNADDTVTYSPGGNFIHLSQGQSTTDSFLYTISDDQGATSTALVTITIQGAAGAVAAVDDSAATDEASPVTIDLLANDIGGSLPVLDLSGTIGLVTLGPGNSVTFEPDGQFESLATGESATDTFTYTITDNAGFSSTATVTVTISGINDTPEASADTAATDERTAIEIDVLADDRDPDASDTLTIASIDDAQTVGMVSQLPGGTIRYDPSGKFSDLASGETATDSFVYEISDGNGGTASASVVVTINGLDAPQVPTDGLIALWTLDETSGTVAADSSGSGHDASFGGSPNWSPGNLDGGLDFSGSGDHLNAGVGPSIVGTGGFSVAAWVRSTGNKHQVIVQQRSPQEFNGEYQFHLTPSGHVRFWTFGGFSYGPFAVSSQTVNDGAWHHVVAVREDDGTSKIYIDGSIDGLRAGAPKPLVPITVYLGADMRGSTHFLDGSLDDVRIYDRAIDADEVEVLFQYRPAGDPQFAVDDAYAIDEATGFSVAAAGLLGNDVGAGLTVSAIDASSALAATITGQTDGSFQYAPTIDTNYLAQGETLIDTFTYTASDGEVEDTATVTVTITGINDRPDATGDATSTDEDTVITVDVLGNDLEVDQSDVLAVDTIYTSSTVGDAVLQADGSITYDPRNAFQSLSFGQSAIDSFSYAVTDGNGGIDNELATITVIGANDLPSANGDAAITDEETAVSVAVLSNDSDVDSGDTISLAGIDTTATVGNVSIINDQIQYDPAGQFDNLVQGQTAQDSFAYTITDNHGATQSATVTITINGVGFELAALDDSASTNESISVVIDLLGNDLDGGSPLGLSVESVDLVGTLGGVVINGDDTVTYDPNGKFESLAVAAQATDTFTYSINDGLGSTDTATVTVTIVGENDAPTAADDVSSTGEDTPITISVLSNDSDPDSGDALVIDSVDVSGTAGAVSVNAAEGTVTYDPAGQFDGLDAGQTGSDQFSYTVSDGRGGSSTATVTIAIQGADEVPIPTDGLIAHWSLDDGNGTSAVDVSGNGHTGALSGDPTWTSGRVGGALQFDGSGDFVNAGIGPSIVGTGGFTVAAWVQTTASSDQVIIQQRSPQQYNGEYMLHVLPGGNVRFWTFGGFGYGPIVASTQTINDGQWHHVAGVREEDGTTKVYIDGALEGSKSGAARPLVPITVYLGADMRGAIKFLDGSLDDVLIYDRPLSASDVSDLFSAQPPASPPPDALQVISLRAVDLAVDTIHRSGSSLNSLPANAPQSIADFDVTPVHHPPVRAADVALADRGLLSQRDVDEDIAEQSLKLLGDAS